jgi:hypothetical protein
VVVIASVPHALRRVAGCIRDVLPRKVARGDAAKAAAFTRWNMSSTTTASHMLYLADLHLTTMKLFLTLVFLTAACSHVAGTVAPTVHAASVKKSATPSSALTLRVRLTDGTVKRVQAAPGDSIEDVCSQVFILQSWPVSETCKCLLARVTAASVYIVALLQN